MTMIGFVPRTRPTIIPLARDVQRCAIIESLGRDRVIATIAARMYDLCRMGHQGYLPRDAYLLSNTLARNWSKR